MKETKMEQIFLINQATALIDEASTAVSDHNPDEATRRLVELRRLLNREVGTINERRPETTERDDIC